MLLLTMKSTDFWGAMGIFTVEVEILRQDKWQLPSGKLT
jgi:hypothetical protein